MTTVTLTDKLSNSLDHDTYKFYGTVFSHIYQFCQHEYEVVTLKRRLS